MVLVEMKFSVEKLAEDNSLAEREDDFFIYREPTRKEQMLEEIRS